MEMKNLSSKIKIEETLNGLENIAIALDENRINDDKIFLQISEIFKQKTSEFRVSVNHDKATTILPEADQQRDECVRAIFNVSKGFEYYPDAEVQKASKLFSSVLDKYSLSMIDENNAKESTEIKSMLDDFNTQQIKDAINRLQPLSQLIANLQTAQANFDEAVQLWSDANTDDDKIESPTTLKKDCLAVCNKKLIAYLNIVIDLDEAKYKNIFVKINDLVTKANTLATKKEDTTETN